MKRKRLIIALSTISLSVLFVFFYIQNTLHCDKALKNTRWISCNEWKWLNKNEFQYEINHFFSDSFIKEKDKSNFNNYLQKINDFQLYHKKNIIIDWEVFNNNEVLNMLWKWRIFLKNPNKKLLDTILIKTNSSNSLQIHFKKSEEDVDENLFENIKNFSWNTLKIKMDKNILWKKSIEQISKWKWKILILDIYDLELSEKEAQHLSKAKIENIEISWNASYEIAKKISEILLKNEYVKKWSLNVYLWTN